jgi:hypothetical protein
MDRLYEQKVSPKVVRFLDFCGVSLRRKTNGNAAVRPRWARYVTCEARNARNVRDLTGANSGSFAPHAHRSAPNQDNSELSPIREGAHVEVMACLQIWLIANALILAWALWPVAPEKPQVEPSLKDPARRQANESVPAAVNFT